MSVYETDMNQYWPRYYGWSKLNPLRLWYIPSKRYYDIASSGPYNHEMIRSSWRTSIVVKIYIVFSSAILIVFSSAIASSPFFFAPW